MLLFGSIKRRDLRFGDRDLLRFCFDFGDFLGELEFERAPLLLRLGLRLRSLPPPSFDSRSAALPGSTFNDAGPRPGFER